MKNLFLLIVIAGILFAGCAKKTVVQPDQSVAEEKAKGEKKAEVAKEAPGEAKEMTKERLSKVESIAVKEVVETKPGLVAIENIHFDFDQYSIRDDAKPVLRGVSNWLTKNKSAKMLLEGHCDERGTNEYNLALGERRAKSTRDYLVSSGITKDKMEMVSLGEERPLCKEQNEECWQKNRRVQFIAK